jgi:DNA repair protein RecN (Recombination protein N)
LEIENILLIERVRLELENGLIVLTGETGAGKSIILNSILFVLGKKLKVGNDSILRMGASKGVVSAIFDVDLSKNAYLSSILSENEIDCTDGELVLKRIVDESAKTRAFVNDKLVSVRLLSDIGDFLLEIHRQNEQKGLLDEGSHLSILDSYGGLKNETEAVASAYLLYKKKLDEYAREEERLQKYQDQRDFLTHLVKELGAVNVRENEEQILSDKRIEMQQSERVYRGVKDVRSKMFEKQDLPNTVLAAQRILGNLQVAKEAQSDGFGGYFESLFASFDKILDELEKVEDGLEGLLGCCNFDETELENIEERLFMIRDMARKYNIPAVDLPNFTAQNAKLLEDLNFSDKRLNALSAEALTLKKIFITQAEILRKRRVETAQKLMQNINTQLSELKMGGAEFFVEIEPVEAISKSGMDKVRFTARTNPGMPFGLINKIASGGELSRFMLALKVALLEVGTAGSIIFDEIDTGISGSVSAAVGEKIKRLSAISQVILVTHQPQIACLADTHLFIQKTVREGATFTNVVKLEKQGSINEIARLLSGNQITEESIQNAVKMLKNSNL